MSNFKTNKQLVKAVLKGKEEAKLFLYNKFCEGMMAVCMRYTRNAQQAEDVFQQAFLKVFERLHQLKNYDALAGWVKTIFVHEALAYGKKETMYPLRDSGDLTEVKLQDSSVDILAALSAEEISSMIQDLPDGCRKVFNLYAIEGYSHKEIAEQMGISLGTSKSQLFEARKSLKEKLERLELTQRKKGSGE